MNTNFSNGEAIGARLRAERKRLGLTQAELADRAGVTSVTQRNYESGKRAPDALYLASMAQLGADVQFIVTGLAGREPTVDEAELLSRYRAASPEVQSVIRAALGAAARVEAGASGATISGGSQGQVVFGGAHQPGMTINVGGSKKGSEK
ncbi:helix-turn-helix domain-containing protein [Lysobacter arvi]|uniref:Helix-turn-helix transcriptional regulator n=1 Tax=Lysobacter arvi TaxID=3038776 RepID=A0ABU1CB98_9GAMM|nr:helix-turn-helix transcriptional regulator [Lysobacter arvi]MDR0182423.1 helix-turn-helix transcriptional regulator [Lysobacter arvi]